MARSRSGSKEDTGKRYYSKPALADRYGVSSRTIDRWRSDGLFPAPDLVLPNGAPRWSDDTMELIRARTSDGRARAKARGVKFGRPTALTPHQRTEALQRLGNGEAQADVARTFNVSQATISRLAAA